MNSPQIHWFWKIVEGFTGKEKKILLYFATSMHSLPLNGFAGLDFR